MSGLDLVVARHGNTFSKGDAVTWVGRNEDPPLVAAGLAQAEDLGRQLARLGWRPARIVASSLRRTRGHAARVAAAAGWAEDDLAAERALEVDPRLDEIDYGPWGGLTSAEIEARGDGAALAAWSETAQWPAAFAEAEDAVRARAQGFARELARSDGEVLLVSSNGVLRYLLDLVPGELARRVAQRAFKLGTGKVGRLTYDGVDWRLHGWDLAPEALTLRP